MGKVSMDTPYSPDRSTTSAKPTVLLVDDQPANLLVLRTILEGLDLDFVEARSGDEAIARVGEAEFAVIILDVQLPGRGGFETARLIRERDSERHTPIIFVTAFDSDRHTIERAYSLGAVDFLVKPLVPVILRAKVAGFVDLYQKARYIRQMERREFERKLAEENERLLVQREWLRTTLHSIGDAVIATDTEGKVTFLNPVAEALTGWPAEEAAGRLLDQVFVIVNEETRMPVESPVAKVLREGGIVGLANHTVLIARDGREVPIDDSAAPIRGEGGVIVGVVMVFRDVTELRRAAEARLRLAAIVDSADEAIIGKDLAGIVRSWNAAAERLYGYTAEEIVGQSLALLVPPDHPDELPALMKRLKRGERIEHFETVRVRKDGTRLAVSLTISPIRDAEGRIVGASKIARDITETRRRESELRFLAGASAALAELQNVPDTLQRVAQLAVPHFADWCTVDLVSPTGTLERVAVAHADPTKVELARDLHRRYPPDPAAPRGVWNVIRSGRSEIVSEINDDRLVMGAKDTEQLEILRSLGLRSYMGVPLSVRGKVLGAITFIAAESGYRYDERDLKVAEDLARRAAVAIENARLYADLKEADQRKDEFLALLGHELRNPLAPIKNALRILELRGDDPEVVRRSQAMIDRQANQLTHLVDELLDASRVSRGKVRLWIAPLDLTNLVHTAIEDHRAEAETAGLSVEVRLPSTPVRVRGDSARLTQVVTNLWNNALKFTPPGGRISVSLGIEDQDAVLSMSDTGIGIAPADLPTLFQAFRQVEANPARSKGGLGLGLAVVKGLVELHGGRVEAASAGAGQGAAFTVRLPLDVAEPTSAPAAPTPAGIASGAGRSVVIIEDGADAAESLRELLELKGFAVSVAANGPAGVELCQQQRPDAVVCDLGLPGMTGFEVARALRADPATAGAVLVAVSGYAQDEDRQKARAAGFDALLAKPSDTEALARLLVQPRIS